MAWVCCSAKDIYLNILINKIFTYFRLPWWFIFVVDYAVEFINDVDTASVSNVRVCLLLVSVMQREVPCTSEMLATLAIST
jgi:hypothetical protein